MLKEFVSFCEESYSIIVRSCYVLFGGTVVQLTYTDTEAIYITHKIKEKIIITIETSRKISFYISAHVNVFINKTTKQVMEKQHQSRPRESSFLSADREMG